MSALRRHVKLSILHNGRENKTGVKIKTVGVCQEPPLGHVRAHLKRTELRWISMATASGMKTSTNSHMPCYHGAWIHCHQFLLTSPGYLRCVHPYAIILLPLVTKYSVPKVKSFIILCHLSSPKGDKCKWVYLLFFPEMI